MKRYRILLLGIILMTAFGTADAREVKFEASVDNAAIALGERAQLGLTFYGTQSMPAPDLGNIDGFEARYLGPSTMMTVLNGRVSSSITHMYALVPLKTGKFQVGPFSFNYQGNTYTSNIVFVEVTEEARAKPAPSAAQEPDITDTINFGDRLFATLAADKATAYVNELVPVTVKLYVNRLNVSDIQLPAFAQEGFSKIEFREPKQYRETLGGVLYDVLEFRTNIFGTRPGEFKLGPASIKCNVVVKKRTRRKPSRLDDFFEDDFYNNSHFDDFFTRAERYPVELKSQEIPITLLSLPEEGRPASFTGAVGDYQFIFNASPTKLKVGDPFTIRMEINGIGNFNTVIMPKLDKTAGFNVYEPQVKTEDRRKTFTQILIPENEKITETPQAVFSYFDPNLKTYKTIVQGPVPLDVERPKEGAPAQVVGPAPAAVPAAASTGEKEELKRDLIYIKDSLGAVRRKNYEIYKRPATLIFLPLPLLALIAFSIVTTRSDRLKRDTRYARRIRAHRAAKKGLAALRHQCKARDEKTFYETLFATLQEYFGGILNLPAAGVTYDVVAESAPMTEAPAEIRHRTKTLFEACDRARFAFGRTEEMKLVSDLKDLESAIAYFERIKL